jgi:hypothetical protein
MTRTRPSLPALDRLLSGRTRALALATLLVVATVGADAPTATGQAATAIEETAAAVAQSQSRMLAVAADRDCGGQAEPFLRTELYFGTSRPNGSVVSEAEFQQFLDQEITPRFPDGLTLLTGLGQFRGSSGRIIRERSMLLILLYPKQAERSSGEKIEQIRAAYLRAFQQESVLRADGRLAECVSF